MGSIVSGILESFEQKSDIVVQNTSNKMSHFASFRWIAFFFLSQDLFNYCFVFRITVTFQKELRRAHGGLEMVDGFLGTSYDVHLIKSKNNFGFFKGLFKIRFLGLFFLEEAVEAIDETERFLSLMELV